VGVAIGLSLAARVVADSLPDYYFHLLAVSAGSWMAAAVAWLAFILPIVIRPAGHASLEKIHKQAGVQTKTAAPACTAKKKRVV